MSELENEPATIKQVPVSDTFVCFGSLVCVFQSNTNNTFILTNKSQHNTWTTNLSNNSMCFSKTTTTTRYICFIKQTNSYKTNSNTRYQQTQQTSYQHTTNTHICKQVINNTATTIPNNQGHTNKLTHNQTQVAKTNTNTSYQQTTINCENLGVRT